VLHCRSAIRLRVGASREGRLIIAARNLIGRRPYFHRSGVWLRAITPPLGEALMELGGPWPLISTAALPAVIIAALSGPGERGRMAQPHLGTLRRGSCPIMAILIQETA
jgi:hypothetical protein